MGTYSFKDEGRRSRDSLIPSSKMPLVGLAWMGLRGSGLLVECLKTSPIRLTLNCGKSDPRSPWASGR